MFGAADSVFGLVVEAAIFSSRDFLAVGGGEPGGGNSETGRPPLGACDRPLPPGKEVEPPPPSAAAAAMAAAVVAAPTVLAFRSVPGCAQVDVGAGAAVDTFAKVLDGGLPPELP